MTVWGQLWWLEGGWQSFVQDIVYGSIEQWFPTFFVLCSCLVSPCQKVMPAPDSPLQHHTKFCQWLFREKLRFHHFHSRASASGGTMVSSSGNQFTSLPSQFLSHSLTFLMNTFTLSVNPKPFFLVCFNLGNCSNMMVKSSVFSPKNTFLDSEFSVI